MHAATYLPTIRIVASEPHPHPCPSPAGRGVRSITSFEKTGSFYHLPREDGFVLSPPSRRRVRSITSLEKTGSFYHLPREDGFVLSPLRRGRDYVVYRVGW